MMSDAPFVVTVDGLSRTFRAPIRDAGLRAAMASVFRPRHQVIDAVRDLSLAVPAGQVVGLIGPNGAGKTTTMKMLAGILHPSSGSVDVLGYRPYARQRHYLRSIALLRGREPIGGPAELTVMDNFQYRRLLYDLPEAAFNDHLADLQDILELGDLMNRQLRALSLGQRMRAGFGLALIHRPRVVFLDEPTIGLDATTAALAFRAFVGRYAASTAATVILTSHYMTEVEALCSRVIVVDPGTVRFDGALDRLAASLSPWKEIRISRSPEALPIEWGRYGELVSDHGGVVSIRVARERAPQVTAALLGSVTLTDLSVLDPPPEVVLDQYYRHDGAP